MRISSKAAHDRRDAGQSILEVVVARGVFALIAATLMALAIGGLQGLEQGGEQTQAQALAQEGMEAVRSIRDRAWNENTYVISCCPKTCLCVVISCGNGSGTLVFCIQPRS